MEKVFILKDLKIQINKSKKNGNKFLVLNLNKKDRIQFEALKEIKKANDEADNFLKDSNQKVNQKCFVRWVQQSFDQDENKIEDQFVIFLNLIDEIENLKFEGENVDLLDAWKYKGDIAIYVYSYKGQNGLSISKKVNGIKIKEKIPYDSTEKKVIEEYSFEENNISKKSKKETSSEEDDFDNFGMQNDIPF